MSTTDQAAKAREAALSGALTQIERQFGKGSVMKMGDEGARVSVEGIPTGALSLDLALGIGGPILFGFGGMIVLVVTGIFWATRSPRPR